MVRDESIKIATYELPLAQELPVYPSCGEDQGGDDRTEERPLSQALLAQNVSWFCQLRWLVIAILVGYGLLTLFPGLISYFGLRSPGVWPFVTAGILTASNLVFLYFARRVAGSKTPPSQTDEAQSAGATQPEKAVARRPLRMLVSPTTMVNLWGQIIADLLVLTAVVYFVGSLETSIAFAYLFHIVVSCVFFSRRWSLIVTFTAVGMFASCIVGEYVLKILPPMSIFAKVPLDQNEPSVLIVLALNFFLTIAIWFAVWYLASHLSSVVRQRDFELAETNRRLVAAQEERSRHMLVTTHQLKAPFAAIYSNSQLLERGYCGTLPDEALQVIQRISARCRRLTAEIQEMLQLANLSSMSQDALAQTRIVSSDLLLWCMSQVDPIARERGVTFKTDIRPVALAGAEDHFKMLFINVLSNAVIYSHKNGLVHIGCRGEPNGEAVITIEDNGIGIAEDKLPHIFEEHYRTKEAVQHNKESSGLGLAIVKHVAERYGIRIRVQSRLGAGTKFELTFPAVQNSSENP